MLQFQLIQPQLAEDNRVLGFLSLVLNDYDDVMAPRLSHDDLYNFYLELNQMFTPGPHVNVAELNPEHVLGMAIHSGNFPRLHNFMRVNGLTDGAPNQIRRILSVTSNAILVPHGPMHIFSVRIHIHCDVHPP